MTWQTAIEVTEDNTVIVQSQGGNEYESEVYASVLSEIESAINGDKTVWVNIDFDGYEAVITDTTLVEQGNYPDGTAIEE